MIILRQKHYSSVKDEMKETMRSYYFDNLREEKRPVKAAQENLKRELLKKYKPGHQFKLEFPK